MSAREKAMGAACGCGHAHVQTQEAYENQEGHAHGAACGCGHEHTHVQEDHEHHQEGHAHGSTCGCGHAHVQTQEAHEHHQEGHAHGSACSCGHEHAHTQTQEAHEHHQEGHAHGSACSCGHEHTHVLEDHEHHQERHAHGPACGCSHEHTHAQEAHEHHQERHGHSHARGLAGYGEKAVFILENLGCAHCASKMEAKIQELPGVEEAAITYATKQLRLVAEHPWELLPEIEKICTSIESEVRVVPKEQKASAGCRAKIYMLENLGCAHCASKMEAKIQELPGVEEAVITYATRQLRVLAQDPEGLLPEIRRICTSIESEVLVREKETTLDRGKTGKTEQAGAGKKGDQSHESKEKRELFALILGALLFVAGIGLSWAGAGELLVLAVYVAAYLILGSKVLLEAFRNLSHGQMFDENFLMSLATLGAFAIREYPEAVGIMLFYRVGEYFEHRAVERSRGQIMEAVDMRPEVVNLVQREEVQVIAAGEAQVGDVLLIRPGDRIPLDGVILEGESRLDTSPITGEPVPVAVAQGDQVTSGCVNTSGQLKMRVERPLEESMVTRILDSVENAAAKKPKIDRFITRFSRIYTPVVVVLALVTAILPSLVTGDWNYWIYTALTFLVMSCPCALVLSVPLAFFSAIGAGSRRGILFKGGASMEALGRLQAVVMDKTGTVTEGNFQLQRVVSAGAYPEEELLRICASCEQYSTHPIAGSITAAAWERGISLEKPLTLEEIAGHGITAELPVGEVLCGNRKLLAEKKIQVPTLEEGAYGAEVFLAVNGSFEGYFLISDTIKPDAQSAVNRLKAMGLHTAMLTGDSVDSAEAVARETGMDDVYAKLLPQDKLDILTKIRQEQGSVMFVGDGINDAPVLAGADVGAAMGSGADAAIEAADAVFMTSSVESIPQAIVIAKRANRIAVQNVVFALAVKVAVMILGLVGFANMWMAVFADTGVAMICVLNSVRVLYQK